MDEVAYWDRWHDLIDMKRTRPFTKEEQEEYIKYCRVVRRLDRKEAKRCAPSLTALCNEHMKVIESIRRLTRALRKATKEL